MKKIKFLLICVLIAFSTSLIAQIYQNPAVPASADRRKRVDSTLLIPTGCGVPWPLSVLDVAQRRSAEYFDSCNHVKYIYDPKLNAWDTIHVGAVSGSVSSWKTDGNMVVDDNIFGSINNWPIRFFTDSVQRAVIDSTTGNVGINITTPLKKLDVSDTAGGILIPRLTSAQMGAVVSPAEGEIIFNTDLGVFYYYSSISGSGVWNPIGTGAVYDATVDFSVNTDPNTGGTTFNPNTPGLTTAIYVSTINGSQWTFNGAAYVLYKENIWHIGGDAGYFTSPFGDEKLGTKINHGLAIITYDTVRAIFDSGGIKRTTDPGFKYLMIDTTGNPTIAYGDGNAGGSGTVTSISQGWGITNTPNPIVSTGTVAVDSNAIKTLIKNDGWYNIVRDGNADTTGVIDASSIVQSANASGWRNIFIPKGTFLFSTSVQLNDSTTIKGAGRFASIIKLTTDISAFKCGLLAGGNNSTFSDIGFYGDYSGGGLTTQAGISIDSAQKILITSISGINIGGFVINVLNNAYNSGYIPRAGKANTITDSYFEGNYGGVNFGARGEYNLIANSLFTNNLYAIQNLGGNNRIASNVVENNTWGLYMTSVSNGGHGVATGNEFNHNGTAGVGANIYLNGLTLGFNFSNNSFAESISASAGLFEIINCSDITWEGGYTVRDTIRTTGCTNIIFSNVRKYSSFGPVWVVVSGQAPTVYNTGKVNNSITLTDAANSKQLDITHLNSKVNFTGTSGIKFGFLNSSADSLVTIGTNNSGGLLSYGGARFPNLPAAVGIYAVRADATGNLSIADTTTGGVSPTNTVILTNKRWTARVGSTTSSATPTINTDNIDIYKLTAQTADITSFTTNLSGTPVDGDILEIQITGTAARAITWGASFVSSTVTLPTTTVTTSTLTVILQYFTTSSYGNNKWICVNSF